ncbi:DUF6920 family protein [Hydrogenovibrio kuenenii]|uniref:DUF6920 family protein n=1 Tax=Hydrogenovibrio kuenenii TaxID=63658 RepID=UPI00046544E8|nr:DUF6544 family protein [Hydrogenovibrio kuenenii]
MKPIFIFLLIVSVLLFFFWRAQSKWVHFTDSQVKQITNDPLDEQTSVNLEEVSSLPPIVQKYFHLVLKNNAPIIQKAHVSQIGGFRAKPELKDWSPMKAEQYFSTTQPGFFWQAKIQMLPGLNIHVCDAFLNGKGYTKGVLAKVIPIIDAHDRPELNQGAFQRYLAEAVWFPTALLPSQGVQWQAVDEFHALATLSLGQTKVSLTFEFNPKGEIISSYTPNRYREVAGDFVPTPWQGKYADYIQVGDYKVPKHGEVEWHLPDQTYPYFQADIDHIQFE